MRSTKASIVIPKLDKIYLIHGITRELKTDNGQPFSSEEFTQYVNILGINHKPVTPYWPQANGEVERFNQQLIKAIQSAVAEGKVWQQELNRFLFQHRNTTHSTTKIAPSELLFNRKVQGKFPTLENHRVIYRPKEARINEERSCSYQETYANKRRKARKSNIQVGDTVLVRQQKRDKLTTRFSKTPYKVVNRKGTQITAEDSNQHRVTRNVSSFKKSKQ